MKIANKISLSFLAVALIVVSTAGTFVYLIVKDNLQKSIYNNLSVAAASRTNHIETYLEMLEISVGQLSKSTILENFLEIKDKEDSRWNEAFQQAMRRLKRTKEANSSIFEFLLLDATGKVVASSDESSIGADKSTDAIFLGGQKKTFIKDIYYSETFKEPLIAVSSPLLGSNTGELLGVLVARVRLNNLNNIVTNRTGMGETGEIYIVNKYGFMITPSRFTEDAVLKQRVDTMNVRRVRLHKGREHVLSEEKMANVFPDYRGRKVLGIHEFIPRMQWAILAEINAKEAFAPLAELRLVIFLILFIAVNTAWLSGISIARFISEPIHRLHKGTEIIGSGNLDYKVGTEVKDEIGQLSRAFDTMTENLKNTTTSIESLNQEVAERKQAEKNLETIFETAPVGMVLLNEKAEVTKINGVIEKLVGQYHLGDQPGNLFRCIHSFEDPKGCGYSLFCPQCPIRNAIKTTLRDRKSAHCAEVLSTLLIDGKKTDIWLEVNAEPITLDRGKCVILAISNITERKKAEKEMKEAVEMKTKFISTASHELRTPLTSIKECINLVYSETTGPLNNDQKEFLGIAKRNVDRLARLINDVLDYQKMTAGRMTFNLKPANINETVRLVEETMRPLVKEKGLELIIELDDAVPFVNFDKDKIIQVLTNLVSNAIKFTEIGSIKVTTSRGDNNIITAVKDSGDGIKQEDMPRLFQEFEQLATKDSDRKTGGTGLGLVISKKIIENHGGRIWAESDYGKGTTFYFELPMEAIPCQIKS